MGSQMENVTAERNAPIPPSITSISTNFRNVPTRFGSSQAAIIASRNRPVVTSSDCATLFAIFGAGGSGGPTNGL